MFTFCCDIFTRYKSNVDETFTQLSIYGTGDNSTTLRGVINWFAVHATSMGGSNTLVSGDNKGVASLILEKELNPGQLVGKVRN